MNNLIILIFLQNVLQKIKPSITVTPSSKTVNSKKDSVRSTPLSKPDSANARSIKKRSTPLRNSKRKKYIDSSDNDSDSEVFVIEMKAKKTKKSADADDDYDPSKDLSASRNEKNSLTEASAKCSQLAIPKKVDSDHGVNQNEDTAVSLGSSTKEELQSTQNSDVCSEKSRFFPSQTLKSNRMPHLPSMASKNTEAPSAVETSTLSSSASMSSPPPSTSADVDAFSPPGKGWLLVNFYQFLCIICLFAWHLADLLHIISVATFYNGLFLQ